MKRYDVYGIGNALVDTEYQVDEVFLKAAQLQKGVMTLIDAEERSRIIDLLESEHKFEVVNQSGGGSAANTMVAISQLGGASFYSCKIANDAIGDFFLQDLVAVGIDTNLDGRKAGISGQCISMVTPDADRTMTTHLGISHELSVQELDEDALRQSKYLYIEGYLVTSPSAFQAALRAQRIARETGVLVSLTLSDPAIVESFKQSFDQFAEHGIDLLFCNEDEAMIWTGSKTPPEAFTKLQTVCKQVAMTCGKDGAMVWDGSTKSIVPATPATALDTTGAGDIFAGVFLYCLSQGQTFAQAASLANRSASVLISRYGARLNKESILAVRGTSEF